MFFEEKENESDLLNANVINLTAQVTDNELEQLLSVTSEASESCSGGVCQLNWRPARRTQAA